ncbi:MAG: LysM peptidoglycan-binding domain-containing protein [Alphaproteobacteria bacterium]|nr:LysM peptidoglycan-binding domain-containing protein [Alphaproteobacteria bacterium]
MKSSTIRRSNLSKEKMAVLEALSKYNNLSGSNSSVDDYAVNSEPIEDGSPEVYVRPSKEKELDLLWKDFRIPKGERSPIVYLGLGFVAGVVTTLALSAVISMSSGNFHFGTQHNAASEIEGQNSTSVSETVEASVSTSGEAVSEETAAESSGTAKKFGLFGSSKSNNETSSQTSSSQSYREYIVQDGDTMEKIAKSFYGTYSPEKVDAIVKANNMKDANRLSIGQKLNIPSEGIVENSAE